MSRRERRPAAVPAERPPLPSDADGFISVAWLPLLCGIVSQVIVTIFGVMEHAHTLEEIHHAHFILRLLSWIPELCYIAALLAVLVMSNAAGMAKMALTMCIIVPLMTQLGVAGFWVFIAGTVAVGVLFALGLGAPVAALIAVLWAPGLIVAAFAGIVLVVFVALDSILLFF